MWAFHLAEERIAREYRTTRWRFSCSRERFVKFSFFPRLPLKISRTKTVWLRKRGRKNQFPSRIRLRVDTTKSCKEIFYTVSSWFHLYILRMHWHFSSCPFYLHLARPVRSISLSLHSKNCNYADVYQEISSPIWSVSQFQECFATFPSSV